MLARNFEQEFKPLCSTFIDYFTSNYSNRPEVWAKCYRNFPHGHTDTNMYCESFHNVLKTRYLNRKQNKRVDVLLDVLLLMKRHRYLQHDKMIITQVAPSDGPLAYMKRHESGIKILDVDIQRVTNNYFSMASQSLLDKAQSTIYFVQRERDNCTADICFQICSSPSCPKLCSHLWSCTCPDDSGICKHIHKVH